MAVTVKIPAQLRGVTDGEGEIDRGERVVAYITGEGLKTLDAVREGFRMHEIEPSIEALDAEFAAAASGSTL